MAGLAKPPCVVVGVICTVEASFWRGRKPDNAGVATDQNAAMLALQETNMDLLTLTEAVCTPADAASKAVVPALASTDVHADIGASSATVRQSQRELLARYHWLAGRVADMQASRSCPQPALAAFADTSPSQDVRQVMTSTLCSNGPPA